MGAVLENVALTLIEDGTQGYKIYIGGRWGKQVAQGQPLNKIFTDKAEALVLIEKALLYTENKPKDWRTFRTNDRANSV